MKKASRKTVAGNKSSVALLLIDVVNDFNFPEAGQLLKHALPMARKIASLKRRCTRAGIPCIYVNDNFALWRSCLDEQIQHCLRPESAGREVVGMLLPAPADYFVLKPKRSGFFDTPLDTILRELQIQTLIITGLATDICVFFTASDANMRRYRLVVPADCVAANTARINREALGKMAKLFDADIRSSSRLNLKMLRLHHASVA